MHASQNEKVVASLPTAAVGSTATSTLVIDRLGYDHVSIAALRASNASTVFANVLKVEESDQSSTGYSDVTSFVAGGTGGFTVPAISVPGTALTSVVKMDIDARAKKRYLRVSMTPGASATLAITARLSKAENVPVDAAEAGVVAWVTGT
jgi:hypothetical protein